MEATEPAIHAWVTVDAEGALSAAQEAERELRSGIDRGPLHGIPVGVKDIFDVAGLPTRCGSAARDDAAPAAVDAPTVHALRQGGAVIQGKTVTQEFAAGVISAPARNPWDTSRSPGGSSGGSAAAVAVGSCLAALGSDTGGSIRIPAAACGVTGFKPAFGRLDVTGVYPLSWSLDTIGPIAHDVSDTWLTWQVLSGALEDSSAIEGPADRTDVRAWRVGVPRAFFFEWLQPDLIAMVERAIDALRDTGATVFDVEWPLAAAARACSFVINRIEGAAVHEAMAVSDPDRFRRVGEELRLRVAVGRAVPAALYIEAARVREVVRDSIAELFARHQIHALLAPTLPTVAVSADLPVVAGTGRQESVGFAHTRLTMPFNATGQPVLALPCGADAAGLPVGLQLAGRPGDDATLFRMGRVVEGTVGGPLPRPPLARAAAT
jgi:aspartyl-tRNA(Asn)/glutamyl-tRNA(Gln) amidotransferase subunit A